MSPDMKSKNDLPKSKSDECSSCDDANKISQSEYEAMNEADSLMTPGTGVTVRMSDLQEIRTEGVLISDHIIDGYLAMRLKQLDFSNVKYLPITFMVPLLTQIDPPINEVDESGTVVYQVNQQMMKNAISPELEFLIITVFRGMHYFLVKLDLRSNAINVFDSIPISQERLPSVENTIREILFSVELEVGKRDWKMCIIQNTPAQRNSSDCGLYVLYNFEAILCRTEEFTPILTCDDLKLFRIKVVSHFEYYREVHVNAKNIADPTNSPSLTQSIEVLPVWRTVDKREFTKKITLSTKFDNIAVQPAVITSSPHWSGSTSNTSTESEKIVKSSPDLDQSLSSSFDYSGETMVNSPNSLPSSKINASLSTLAKLSPISGTSGKLFTSSYPLFFTADDLQCLNYPDSLYPNIVEAYLYTTLHDAEGLRLYTLLTSQFVQANYTMNNGRYVTDSAGNRYVKIEVNTSEIANITTRYFVSPFITNGEYALIYGDMETQFIYIFNTMGITRTRRSILLDVTRKLVLCFKGKDTTWSFKINQCINLSGSSDSGILILQQFERLLFGTSYVFIPFSNMRIKIMDRLSSLPIGQDALNYDEDYQPDSACPDGQRSVDGSVPYETISTVREDKGQSKRNEALVSHSTSPVRNVLKKSTKLRPRVDDTKINRGNCHDLAERQSQRIRRLICTASEREFQLTDYSDPVKLKSLETSHGKGKNLLVMIRKIGSANIKLSAQEALREHYSPELSHKIFGVLSHYACIQKYGKSFVSQTTELHLATCKKLEPLVEVQESSETDSQMYTGSTMTWEPSIDFSANNSMKSSTSPDPMLANPSNFGTSTPKMKLRDRPRRKIIFTPTTNNPLKKSFRAPETHYKFCICKESRGGPMIKCCAIPKCTNGLWFHYEVPDSPRPACVTVCDEDRMSGTIWFCPGCISNGINSIPSFKQTSPLPSGLIMKDIELPDEIIHDSSDIPMRTGDENDDITEDESRTRDQFDQVEEDSLWTNGSEFFTIDDVIEIEGLPPQIKDYLRPDSITIRIPYKDFADKWDFELLRPKPLSNWATLIDQQLAKLDFPCSFHVKDSKPTSPKMQQTEGVIRTVAGYCKYARRHSGDQSLCQTKFSCKIMDHLGLHEESRGDLASEDVVIECKLSGNFVLFQTSSTCRPVKGNERVKLKAKLEHERSFKCRRHPQDEVRSAAHTKWKGFVQAMLDVAHKLNTNAKFIDSNTKLSGYVRDVSSFIPHSTILYSPQQIKFASKCDELYIDSTGNVVPPILVPLILEGKKKQVLLHVAVGRKSKIPSHPPVPVFEVLSTVGNVAFITSIMLHFAAKEKIHSNKAWTPSLIVTDFCLAYLHSASLAILEESLDAYINRKYDLLIGKQVRDKKTILFICSGHFMHANSKYLRKNCPSSPCIFPALHAFARLIESRTQQEIQTLVEIVTQLFGNRNLNNYLVEDYNKFLTEGEPLSESVEESLAEKMDDDFHRVETTEDPKLQREKSKFFIYFKQAVDKMMTQEEVFDDLMPPSNKYFNTKCLDTFQRWFTYLPLWSKIGFVGKDNTPDETITTGLGRAPKRKRSPEAENSSNKRPKKRAGTRGFVGSPAFATARWGKRTVRKSTTYVPKIKAMQKGKSLRGIALPESKFDATQENLSTSSEINISGPAEIAASIQTFTIDDDSVFERYLGETHREMKLDSNDWAVSTKKRLELFKTPLYSIGNEEELLCLNPGALVNDAVANAIATQIFENSNYANDRKFKLIVSNFIEHTPKGIFVTRMSILPDKSSFDKEYGTIFMLGFTNTPKHCFLNSIHFDTQTVLMYDSLPEVVDKVKKRAFFDALVSALNSHFELIEPFWTLESYPCPPQNPKGNDCAIMALGFLKVLVTDKAELTDVNQDGCLGYRQEYVGQLLSSTADGKAFFLKCNNDPILALSSIVIRHTERQKMKVLAMK
ncbi:Sentrin-specific protease 3 [Folsomia candida]|uniref:Sentrin-specific protease 3 n=1 Tax=Folsomia candida TaxID=158441 RepID=A0A226DL62_FOLCA|nr:Sentrin-specific protease 3 [Folsomia candida]